MTKRLEKIINWMTEFKTKNNVKGVVLGLSGGKDSTVVAMLAKMVYGDNVVAIMMPNGFQSDLTDSVNIAKILKLKSKIVNIEDSYNHLLECIEGFNGGILDFTDIKVTEKSKTNIAPRIRMTTLYAIAQSLGYLVIGTGNYSEYMIGWTTKFGDSACDFNPIQHLTCSEVILLGRELARKFKLPIGYIVKKPSDGLTGKTDEDNFGFTYKELDEYLINNKKSENIDKIKNMIKWSEHKKVMPKSILDK